SEIRKIFERSGGHLGSAGTVAYLFERKGVITVPTSAVDEDTLLSIVLDAGADDLKREGDAFAITCDPSSFNKVQEALESNNVPVASAELTQLPKAPVDADLETAKRVVRLVEALDDHDDVQNVYSSLNFTDALAVEMAKE